MRPSPLRFHGLNTICIGSLYISQKRDGGNTLLRSSPLRIADDARGLAALLAIVRAFNTSGIKTSGDIIFSGNVGEEGLGDLRTTACFVAVNYPRNRFPFLTMADVKD